MKIFYGGMDYITENGVELIAHCEESKESKCWSVKFGNAKLKYFNGEGSSFEARKFMKKFASDNFEIVEV